MSVLSLLLLVIIIYFCAKAVGSIWRDAFGTIDGSEQKSRTNTRQQHTASKHDKGEQPISKGEGEYVDYEEL